MLDARSPGERAAGALTQSKKRVEQPYQRALGKVFPPKPTPAEQLAKVIVPPTPVQIIPPPEDEPVLADVIAPGLLLASLPPISGTELLNPPFAPVLVAPPPPPINSAVPEPGTWLMMLIGFAMIGSAMPRRRSVRTKAVPA